MSWLTSALAGADLGPKSRCDKGPVIHHSDQGTQYTSLAFGRRLREAGVLPLMGSRGDAFDNALAESFWSTLERELLDDTVFINRAAARLAVFN